MKKQRPVAGQQKKPLARALPARKDSPEPSIRDLGYYVPGYIG